jgi:hypothetical protein
MNSAQLSAFSRRLSTPAVGPHTGEDSSPARLRALSFLAAKTRLADFQGLG